MSVTAAKVLEVVFHLRTTVGASGRRGRLWVAYSGGLDSHVLLHVLASQRAGLNTVGLHAVHVDHGLSPHARRWVQHCRDICAHLGLPCVVLSVDAGPGPGESREAWARRARYAALAELLQDGDCLLTAQHRDDQAETFLLQLLRGAGPHGLAGMPPTAALGAGWLLRPLLAFTRAELRHYGERHGLLWVDDESNYDTSYDRNYLRHAVLPRLRLRWPALAATIARAARLQAENAQLLDLVASEDVRRVGAEPAGTLSTAALQMLSPARQRNLVRYWLRTLGLPLPSARHLHHVLSDVLNARSGSEPCVRWHGAEVRRYRERLFGLRPLPDHDPNQQLDWDTREPLQLPNGNGTLTARRVVGEGLREGACQAAPVSVRFRCGGERCRPAGRGHHRSLKKLFQEAAIPPWQRDRVPLIYIGDQLAQIVGLCRCHSFEAEAGEPGLQIEWRRGSITED